MNLNHLRAFVAVAEGLSFSRGAERLHVSQPALSSQIKLLEDDLGVELFVRNTRRVSLSVVGEELLGDAERLLGLADEIRTRATRARTGMGGTLRLGFVASATVELVPRIAVGFRKAFPDVGLELRNVPTAEQVVALRAKELDAGIVRLPLGETDVEVVPLLSEPFAIVLAKGHELVRSRAKVGVKDLAGEGFVSYRERQAPAFFQHWTGICRRAGFTPRIVQEVGEMETALALVSAGVGVGIVPEGVAARYRRSLVVVSLKGERVRSEIGLALLKVGAPVLARKLARFVGEMG